jgi:1,2-diacylglycerol-3-alpha-glucose alpha-1,2-glucosyltransferase
MKICLYLEFYHFLGGFLYKKIGTGLLSSYMNQKKILTRLGIPFTERWDDSCDILQINTPWLYSLWLIKKARAKGKKVIIWSHVSVEDTQGVFRFNKIMTPLTKAYLRYAYGQADLVFAPSEYTKSLLIAYGLPEEKIMPMSNGVDLDKFFVDESRRNEMRAERSLSGTVIGTVGLAIPRKDINTFLLLAEKFPKNKFVWFGKIYASLIVKPLPKHIPNNVGFTGYVSDIVAAFNALDIFLFPSHEENQGMVLLEAAAVGLPMLVRDIPVYNPWLVHNENCLKAKNEEEFVSCLDMLIKDASLRQRLGEKAKLLAQNESLTNIAAKTLDTYKKLLK